MKILDLTNSLIFNISNTNYINNGIYYCYSNPCSKLKKWFEDNKDKELELIIGLDKIKGKILKVTKLSTEEMSIYVKKTSSIVFKLDEDQVRQYQRDILLKNLE
jgi:hypothetical protein